MNAKPLDIAFWNYDRTRALAQGQVAIEGVDPSFHTARIVTDIFRSMVKERAFDVSELGMTYFLRTFAKGESPFVALPVFPVRSFRHGAIYINKASGIERPEDLARKRIGELALYGHDAGIMSKGMLSDEFGFRPEQSRWLVGGIDFPMDPIDFVPSPVPADVEVEYAPEGADLGDMLEAGQIDALISADVPRCILDRSPRVGRLFENYEDVERDYYERTGIFPIMHGIVVTRELAESDPALIRSIYEAFCDARDRAMDGYTRAMTFNNMDTMHPWLTTLIEKNRRTLGRNGWPYGIKANRAALDAILRYHHEQGMTDRRFRIEDVFVTDLLDT